MIRRPPRSPLFPSPTLSRSHTLGTGTASWIEPETNAYSPNVRGQLASGKTCVLARVRTATKVTVSPFNGDTLAYWLVSGMPDSKGRSWFVPNNGGPASPYTTASLQGHQGVHGPSPWG